MMKAVFSVAALAIVLLAPGACFALWDIVTVTKDQAKDLGLEVRTKPAGQNRVWVELEFKTEGHFGAFSPEGKFKDRSGVELRIGDQKNPDVTAQLQEDRPTPGRVVVRFTVSRKNLDQTNLQVMAPYQDGGLGGATFVLEVKDFIEPEEKR